jgi:hypothetical protein
MLEFEDSVQTRFMNVLLDILSGKTDGLGKSLIDFDMLSAILNGLVQEILQFG